MRRRENIDSNERSGFEHVCCYPVYKLLFIAFCFLYTLKKTIIINPISFISFIRFYLEVVDGLEHTLEDEHS